MDEIRAVACNYIMSTSACSKGAKAFVLGENPGNGNDRIRVLARSRGGRWIEKYEDSRHLGNFRVVTVVAATSYFHALRGRAYVRDAEGFAAAMSARQFYDADRPIGADSRARA